MPWSRALAAAGGLPVAAHIGRMRQALDASAARSGGAPALVVQAPPGTGKTTLVPMALAARCRGRVVVTQPRRVAARAAARRIAALVGEGLGRTVGYTVRGEGATSRATRVEMVTPGVLVRRLQRDPELPGVDAVVVDEAHERSLESDLALAFAADVRANLREDLALVAMSATAEAERMAGFLGADVLDIPAAGHPVDVRWAPPADGAGAGRALGPEGVRREFLSHVASTVRRAMDRTPAGDVLVFLPGVREIGAVAAALEGLDGAVVERLHGRMPPEAQDRVLAPTPVAAPAPAGSSAAPGRSARRVILSTAVAESSLTVPGVRVVVDAGLSREARTDYGRGVGGLVTVRESQASGVQRAGRAGREGPGVAFRCMDQATWSRLAKHAEPEVRTADLTGFALELACWGATRLLEEPPEAALDAARTVLRGIGCIDADGAVTPLGRRIVRLPLEPRLGRALVEAAPIVGARTAAEVCALVEEGVRVEGADLAHAWRQGDARLRRSAERLERLAGGDADDACDAARVGRPAAADLPDTARTPGSRDEALALVVGLAYPERIGRLRAGSDRRYLLAGGLGAELPPHSPLAGQEWLAVAGLEATGRADALIRTAVPIADLGVACTLRTVRHDVEFTEGRLRGRRVEALGAVEVSSAPEPPDPAAAREWMRRAQYTRLLEWSREASLLRERLAFLHAAVGEPWPDVGDAALAERQAEWAGPEIDAFLAGRPLRPVSAEQLSRLLPWPEARDLERLAPRRIGLPLGSAPVAYSDGRPRVSVRIQEVFGLQSTPDIAGIPVAFELLSPARRPLAVTDDLSGFWDGAYAQVRAEMRGRYPRHPWPADPANAEPTRRTKRPR